MHLAVWICVGFLLALAALGAVQRGRKAANK
jgi:hypothetical protein